MQMKRGSWVAVIIALGLATIGTTSLLSGCGASMPLTPVTSVPVGFEGRLLVTSDADQIGTSYADGYIAAGRARDALTRLGRGKDGRMEVDGVVEVSNSVISWPRIIAVSPDGRFAYVAETRGQITKPTEKVDDVWTDLPNGTNVSVVELGDTPRVVQQQALAVNPNALSLNFDGTLLALTSKETGGELVIAKLVDGLIVSSTKHPVAGMRKGNYGGVASVEFHPSKNTLAVNVNCTDVAIVDVTSDGAKTSEVGRLPAVARLWSMARWTPDGRHVLLSDVGWGYGTLDAATNDPGEIVSVRVGPPLAVVSRAKVGLSPEGFDLSPDGSLAVTSNMRRTYLPNGLPYCLFGARDRPSLAVVRVDPATGVLTRAGGEYGFDGELPEDVAFDDTGKWLAVAIFNERHDRDPKNGFVEFWRVDGDRLVRTDTRLPVTRGAHTLRRISKR